MTAAIALNRFGLGARPDEAAPAEPSGWLLQQLERWDPLSPAWAAQPRSAALVADLVARQRAARQQSDPQARQAAQQAYRRAARDQYISAVGARVQSALAFSLDPHRTHAVLFPSAARGKELPRLLRP